MPPAVTIVIPVYNHERFIRECVDSVLAQAYAPLEVIVIDDGSTDGTPAILEEFGARIRVIRQANAGAARALNRGLLAANGEWIGWLSSDDAYLPGKLAAQITTAAARPNAGVLYTDWIKVDAEGRELSRHRAGDLDPAMALWRLMEGNFINGSSVLMHRRVIAQHGVFNEALRADVDGEMWFRLLCAGVEFARTEGFFLRYRWHRQNLSHQRLLMRQSMDSTRLAVVRDATTAQLFPVHMQGGRRRAVHLLIRALLRHECFGAASLAIARASETGDISLALRLWSAPLRWLSSPRWEPVIAGARVARRLAARLRPDS